MKISIDGTPIFGERAIKRYTYNLIKYLAKIDNKNKYFIFYIAYYEELQKKVLNCKKENFKNIICKIPGKVIIPLWNKINYPYIEYFTGEIDIFHSTDFDIPATKKAKIIFTLHGISYLESPKFFPDEFISNSKYLLDLAIKKSKFFIAVSNNTKEKFIEYSKISEDRIKVINLGVGDEFYIIEDRNSVRNKLKIKFDIDTPYILYVGAIEKWKNIEGILEGYKILKEKNNLEQNLILAGQKGYYFDEFIKKIKKYKLENNVKYIGNISQETDDLLFLYNCADLFIFPSFVEGFTSPPLEAMKCGCPVITSNISSLPETVGDSAIKVNPYNPEEIADAMYKVLQDNELRNNLIKKGLQWSSQFTWEKMAKEHLDFYEDVGQI